MSQKLKLIIYRPDSIERVQSTSQNACRQQAMIQTNNYDTMLKKIENWIYERDN